MATSALGAALVSLLVWVMPPCTTEDSTWCVWDAQFMGNGEGYSFVALGDWVLWL